MRPERTSWPIVAGSALSRFARSRDGSTWRDRGPEVARAALAEAGLAPTDIDALVVATESDIVSLQVNPASVIASEIGLSGVAAMRVEGGGASGGLAVRAGVLHILSGLHRRVLVVGFDDAASRLDAASVGLVYGLSFDAEVEGFAGATATALYALSIQEHMARTGLTEAELAAIAVKNRGNALANPNAHRPAQISVAEVLASPVLASPYKRLDCSPLSDGAAAIVLARPEDVAARKGPRTRIVASAAANDHVRLGDRAARDRFTAKTIAARTAYAQAGISDPSREIGVAEVYDAYTGAEVQALEALGLVADGRGGSAATSGELGRDGRLPVNLSGGLIGQGSAPGATGIAQVATLARLLEGRYHQGLQPARILKRGLADAHGGIATVCTVHILEREEA